MPAGLILIPVFFLFFFILIFITFCSDIYGSLSDDVIKDSVHLGLHRSDYMINMDENSLEIPLQVEINTIASSFGCLSKKVGDFHRFMLQRNSNSKVYQNLLQQTSGDSEAPLEVFLYFLYFFHIFYA